MATRRTTTTRRPTAPRRSPAALREQRDLRRAVGLEIRRAMEKAEALRNLPDLAPQGAGDPPTVSRLLVLRSTPATRALEATYGHVLAAAYPATAHDVLTALTGTAPWPGAGILWMTVEGGGAHVIERRPRRPVR